MSSRLSPLRSRALGGGIFVALFTVLVACAPTPDPAPSESEPAPTASASPAAEEPVFDPDGSAEDNLPIFTSVTESVWESDDRESGRAYIDALVEAGFDRDLMQVTDDTTTVGNAVESMQFSVRWGDDQCLVGQVGPSTGDPVTAVLDQLDVGRCLIGATRAIDW
ncbi:MAG: DUF6993 domain-containing protein [Actinomycetota bacterium]